MGTLPKELLHLLACPACKIGLLEEDASLHCTRCEKTYPITEGIPRFL